MNTLGILLLTVLFAVQAGPTERQRIDNAAADRGRALYTQNCINCHGGTAKGTDSGPDLIRSAVVLRDRLGNGIGPAIRAGGPHQTRLTDAQIVDLSHFLHQRVESIASNRNPRGPINVLTGDAEAGLAYFNGEGKCSTCHSTAGDLEGIASRIPRAVDLQQRFLFPSLGRGGKQVEVTVTPAGGPAISGTLVRIDTFFVSLRDASGQYQTFPRPAGTVVDVRDPLAAHHEMLDHFTERQIHDVVTYLGTLK